MAKLITVPVDRITETAGKDGISGKPDQSSAMPSSWAIWFSRVSSLVNNVQESGVTADRPTKNLYVGRSFFDTTIGKPVWYDGTGWVTAMEDLMLEWAAGNKTGYSTVNKFGRNTAIAANATEDIWDGSAIYTWPSSASVTHIRSAVDSATTQGMVVEVQGLDTNWDLSVQNATLDGTDSTTEVALTTALRRVFRMRVLDSSLADQNIQVGPTGFATQQGVITAGNNQTLMALYTVPNGKTAYMTNYYASLNPAANQDPTTMQIRLWGVDNENGYARQLKHTRGLDADASNMFQHKFEPYYKFTQKTDIYIDGTTVGKAADISAGFDLILVDN